MSRRPRTTSPAAKWLAWVLVGALVAGTAVLVYLALQRVQTPTVETPPEPVPTFTLGAPRSATPTADPSTPPSPSAAASLSTSGQRFLAVGSGTIWRATAGDCGETAPLMERSDDGGDSWIDVTPLYRGIGQVLALDAFAGTEAEAVAAMGDTCEAQALRTFTQGEFWESYPEVLSASHYLDPANPGSVITPDGPVAAPCPAPSGFRTGGSLVVLICDGTPHRLDDGEWSALPGAGVTALAIDGDTVLTAGEGDGCSGAQVSRLSGADLAQTEPQGCATDADLGAPLAIAADGDTALLWAGEALATID